MPISNKINATWITHLCFNRSLLVAKWILYVEIKIEQASFQFSQRLQNMIATHAGKDLYTSSAGKHSAWYKTDFITLKTVLTFQTLMLATLRQMGHDSRQGSFSGQDLVLDFAAWIDLTSNAGNSLIKSKVQSYKTHFVSLKCVNDLWVYRGFMIPLNHQAGYKVVNRALIHHISFPSVWMVFALTLDRFTCCVSHHNNLCKNLFPDFALYAICC